MKKYKISGMSCAACVARVEKAVGALDGVAQCSVNLLTNSMAVESDLPDSEIIRAVTEAGYGAEPMNSGTAKKSVEREADPFLNREIPILRNRLIASVGFLLLFLDIHNIPRTQLVILINLVIFTKFTLTQTKNFSD